MDLRKELELDISGALRSVQNLNAEITSTLSQSFKLGLDTTDAQRQIQLVKRRLGEIRDAEAELGVVVDDSELVRLDGDLGDLESSIVAVDVTANDAELQAALDVANAGAAFNVDVTADDSELQAALSAAEAGAVAEIDLVVTGDDAAATLAELDAGVTSEVELQMTGEDAQAILDDLDAGVTSEVKIAITGDDAKALLAELDAGVTSGVKIAITGDDAKALLAELDAGVTSEVKIAITGDDAKALLAELDAGVTSEVKIEADTSEIASGDDIAAALATPLAAAGVAAAAIFTASLGEAISVDASIAAAAARSPLPEADIARLGEAAGNLYAGAYGASIEDNLSVLEGLARFELVATADISELESAGAAVQDFAAIWQQETGTVLSAIDQLNQFDLADGPIDGLNQLQELLSQSKAPADELLESIREYSPFLADAGLSFEDFGKIVVSSGASTEIEIDKIGDSIKELTILIDEVDADVISVLGAESGLAATEIEKLVLALQQGDPGAFEEVITVMQGIEDPAARARFSVELFGAAGEDVAALFREVDFAEPFEVSATAIADAGAEINDSLIVRLTELGRTFQTEVVNVIIAEVLPAVEDFVASIDADDVRAFTTEIQTAVTELVGFGRAAVDASDNFNELFGLTDQLADIDEAVTGSREELSLFGEAFGFIESQYQANRGWTEFWSNIGSSVGDPAIDAANGVDILSTALDGVPRFADTTTTALQQSADAVEEYQQRVADGLIVDPEVAAQQMSAALSAATQVVGTEADAVIAEFTELGQAVPEEFAAVIIDGIAETQPDVSQAFIESLGEIPIEELVEYYENGVPTIAEQLGATLSSEFADQKDVIEESLIEATSLDGVIETFEDGLQGLQDALDAQELRYDVVDQLGQAGFDDVAEFAKDAGNEIIDELNDALASGDLDKIIELERQFDELREIESEISISVEDAELRSFIREIQSNPTILTAEYGVPDFPNVDIPDVGVDVDFNPNTAAVDEEIRILGETQVTALVNFLADTAAIDALPDFPNPDVDVDFNPNTAAVDEEIRILGETQVTALVNFLADTAAIDALPDFPNPDVDVDFNPNTAAVDEEIRILGETQVTALVNFLADTAAIDALPDFPNPDVDVDFNPNTAAVDEEIRILGETQVTALVNFLADTSAIDALPDFPNPDVDVNFTPDTTAVDEEIRILSETQITALVAFLADTSAIDALPDFPNPSIDVEFGADTTLVDQALVGLDEITVDAVVDFLADTTLVDQELIRLDETTIDAILEMLAETGVVDGELARLDETTVDAILEFLADTGIVDEELVRLDATEIDALLEFLADTGVADGEVARLDQTLIDGILEFLVDDSAVRSYNPPTLQGTVNYTPTGSGIFADGGIVDPSGLRQFMAGGIVNGNGIVKPRPGGVAGTINGLPSLVAENGGAELLINERSHFGRQLSLIDRFANGKLAQNLESHYFGRFANLLRSAPAITAGSTTTTTQTAPSNTTNVTQTFNVSTPVRDSRQAAHDVARQLQREMMAAMSRDR